MSSTRSLHDVALASVQALKHRKKFRQTDLAKRLHTTPAAVSETLNGKRGLTLRFLEGVADLTGVHPGELLSDPYRDQIKIVNPQEMQMLRYFRSWPVVTREALLSFASFFANEEPSTHDLRRAFEQLRRLPEGKRHAAFAYLTFQAEGFFPGEDLPPDIRKALEHPVEDATQSPRSEKAKRRANQP